MTAGAMGGRVTSWKGTHVLQRVRRLESGSPESPRRGTIILHIMFIEAATLATLSLQVRFNPNADCRGLSAAQYKRISRRPANPVPKVQSEGKMQFTNMNEAF